MRFNGIGEWLRVPLQGRSFACLLFLISLTVLLSARPASAGVWRFHVSDTSYSHTINGSNFGSVWNPPADANNSIGLNIISVGGSGMVNQSVTAAATLSATITATWIPDPSLASDPVPSPTSMKITSSAWSYGINGGTLYYGNSANDGLSDPVNSTGVSQGVHLIPVTGSTFTISVSLSASYTSPANSSMTGFAAAVINGLTIAPDTRTLVITDQTYGKFPEYNSNGTLSYDANGDENFVSQPHIIVNDVMYGDTIFSYNDTALSETFPYWQTLLAGYGGAWHTISGEDYQGHSEDVPNVDWAWSPAGSATAPDTWDHHDMFEPYAINFHLENGAPVGSDPSQTITIGYEAVDKIDGAAAVASYVMVLHDLYERNYPDHVVAGIENVRPAPNAEYVRNNQSTSEPLTVYMEKSDSWSLGFAGDGAVAAWIAAEENINVSASYTFSVNSGAQATVNDVQPGWAIYLQEFDAYNYHTDKTDEWNEQGYVGTTIHHFKVPQNPCGGIQASTPVYEPVGNPGS